MSTTALQNSLPLLLLALGALAFGCDSRPGVSVDGGGPSSGGGGGDLGGAASGGHAHAGEHGGGAGGAGGVGDLCCTLGALCHVVGDSVDPEVEHCHVLGHEEDQAACAAEFDHCVSVCAGLVDDPMEHSCL